MALQKQTIDLNFSQGLDTKSDPYQVQIGKYLSLVNSVFDTEGRLTKRFGFPLITTLPNANQTNLTTHNNSLIATGSNLFAFSQETDQWIDQGSIQPVQLDVIPLVRMPSSQESVDTATAPNGLTIVTYKDGSALYYHIMDAATGQQVVPRTLIVDGVQAPRCFVLGAHFVITYVATIMASTHLQYISIPLSSPQTPAAAQDVSTTLTSVAAGYDGAVYDGNLYIGWSDTGSTMNMVYLSSTLILSAPVQVTGSSTKVSVCADSTTTLGTIWMVWFDPSGNDTFAQAFDPLLAPIGSTEEVISNISVATITSSAQNSICNVFIDVLNDYAPPYPTMGIATHYIMTNTVDEAGNIGTPEIILRSVGLGSKSFISSSGTIYMLAMYGEESQPTYFLIDSTGNIYMKLAYGNASGYYSHVVLPSVSTIDDVYHIAYLQKNLLVPINKTTDPQAGVPLTGIFTQTGINLAKFSINNSEQFSSEIASTLHLTGGILWQYDGVKPVEQGFNVWPENVQVEETAATGGQIEDGTYNYVFTYEWTDNQGRLHRSAPSIPKTIVISSGNQAITTSYVPTLRLTYKVDPNSVRIVGYRWSDAQQTYYQFTSITNPTLNDPTVDFVEIVDDQADLTIIGQTLLYTTGGVLENIAPPASTASALFKNRLFIIDAEDQNRVWYSKEVIQNTPVEFSDLLTLYVAPTSGAQGSTGPCTALFAMDDKVIIFKRDAIYYVVGQGPDSTGANNDFTDPIYITSSVGCTNPNSLVLMPLGVMFQSDKGIWLLGRDLSTKYIGAPVEAYNDNLVRSARAIPGTNQVRFILDNNITLMYDYYYDQWGTFTNIRAISSTLFEEFHTYLNSNGQVFQETPGTYTDGSSPVLMSFQTAWIDLAGIQGYQRFYFALLLGTYYTPFKLSVDLSYDFGVDRTQTISVTPDNYTPNWGDDPRWGDSSPWGGPGNVFKARIFPENQRCESFQLTVTESYDNTKGVAPGAGLTLSGLSLVIGGKRGYRPEKASQSFG